MNSPLSSYTLKDELKSIRDGELSISTEQFEQLRDIFLNQDVQNMDVQRVKDDIVEEVLEFLGYEGVLKIYEQDIVPPLHFYCYKISRPDILMVIVPYGNSIMISGDSAYQPITIPILVPHILDVDEAIVTNGFVWALCNSSNYAGDAHIVDLKSILREGSLMELEQFYRHFRCDSK